MDNWGELRSLLHGTGVDLDRLFVLLGSFPKPRRDDAIAYALGAMGKSASGGLPLFLEVVSKELLSATDHSCWQINGLQYPNYDAVWLKALMLPGGDPRHHDVQDYIYGLKRGELELITDYRFGDRDQMSAHAGEVIAFMLGEQFVNILPEAVCIWHNHESPWTELTRAQAADYFEALWTYEDEDDYPWSNLPIPAELCVDRVKIEGGILGESVLDPRSVSYWMPSRNSSAKIGSNEHEPILVGLDRHAMVIAWLE